MTPLVSVVMPAYNAERYIAEAIASVQAQTLADWELLVADDGSTDGTRSVVEAIGDRRIRMLPLPHGGSPARSRNAGIRAATAPLVAFLDADDRFFPGALETLLRPLQAEPGLQAAFGFQYLMAEDGRPLRPSSSLVPLAGGGYRLADDYRLDWPALYQFRVSFAPSALMARRTALDAIGGFDERTLSNEDFKLYVQLIQGGLDRIRVVPTCVYYYRLAGGSLTKNRQRAVDVLDAENGVVDWLYAQPTTTPELARHRPAAYATKYVTYAREWHRRGDGAMARDLLARARQKGHLRGAAWWRHLGGYWARTWLPVRLDDLLAGGARAARTRLHGARSG